MLSRFERSVAATRQGATYRNRVREALQLVVERFEDAVAACMLERAREQPVRQSGVAGQQRSMEIGADRSGHATAFEP